MLAGGGWATVAQKRSHRQLKDGTKTGRVTVEGKPNHDVSNGTLNSILKQAGLTKDDLP